MAKSSKQLPISYPMVSTYFHHGHLLSVIGTHPEAYSWVYNYYVQLNLPTNYDNFLLDFYMPELWKTCPWVHLQHIDRDLIENNESGIKEFIIKCIDSGNYLKIFTNQYYIPASSSYNIAHFKHPNFIYGYCNSSQEYYISDNFAGGKYNISRVSFKEFEWAYKSMTNLNSFCNYEGIEMISLKNDVNFEFNYDVLTELLKDYLYSKSTNKKVPFISESKKNNYLFGLDIYHFLIQYVNSLPYNRMNIDIRLFHLLSEHKKVMCLRVQFLIEQNAIEDSDKLYETFKIIESKSINLLKLVLKYIVTKDKNIIHKIIDNIKFIQFHEGNALDCLIKKLEHHQKPNIVISYHVDSNECKLLDLSEVRSHIYNPNKTKAFGVLIPRSGIYKIKIVVQHGPNECKFMFSTTGSFKNNEYFHLFDLYDQKCFYRELEIAEIEFSFPGVKEFKFDIIESKGSSLHDDLIIQKFVVEQKSN